MSDKYVYEVVDITSDEMYYPCGMFLSMLDAILAIRAELNPERAVGDNDDVEYIQIRRHVVGELNWSEAGTPCYLFEREVKYDESKDEYLWHTTEKALRVDDE